jgi:hypothetical protein
MHSQRMPAQLLRHVTADRVVINFLHQIVAFWAMMAAFQLLTVPHWTLVWRSLW